MKIDAASLEAGRGRDRIDAGSGNTVACDFGRRGVEQVGGQAGVARAIEIIRKELNVTMALTGISSIREIGRHVVVD